MKNKYCAIDFEFNRTSEASLNLVCAALKTSDDIEMLFWLSGVKPDRQLRIGQLKGYLESIRTTHIFVAHNVVSEAASFMALGLDPTEFKWIDTMMEFRCLTNHNAKLQYGEHYVDGKVKKLTKPIPKWARNEGESGGGAKLTHSLSQMVYKLLGEKLDTEHKEEMRRLIISDPDTFKPEEREAILNYCASDVEHLIPALQKMAQEYANLLSEAEISSLMEEMLWRGETCARTAIIERKGYPIDYEGTRNFAASVKRILWDIEKDINDQFPEITPFKLDPKTLRFTKTEKPIRDWIDNLPYASNWTQTDGKKHSLSLDAFQKFFDFRHDYPRGNFGAQMVRYLKTKQNLNGFIPRKTREGKKPKKTFWDYVGSDGRVRPYLNPYGSITARYYPSATGFIFLKAAWMRSLVVPPKGKMIVGIDWKSVEFLLQGILSNDRKMIEAYKTGDVYLAFGKDCGAIPPHATKKTHPVERQASKSSVLGIGYDMTKYGLSRKLTNEAQDGREYSEEEAQEWIDNYQETYLDNTMWKQEILENYQITGKIKQLDGWYMFGDNENFRSVGNNPVQGACACILRKAIQLCQDALLDVIVPLHDALYCEIDVGAWGQTELMASCMEEAFCYFFKGKQLEDAKLIGMDIEAWSPELDLTEEVEITTTYGKTFPVTLEHIHKDERALSEYERFSKYFARPKASLL